MAAPWVSGAQCRIIGTIHGQETVNVLHFATNHAVLDIAELNGLLGQLVDALIQCVRTTLLPAVTEDWRLDRVEAHQIFPVISDPMVQNGIPGDVGELSPASVSFSSSLMNYRTGIGGRRGRGRSFLPPAGETEITNSTIDPATGVLLVAFAACLASNFVGVSANTFWRLGILSTTDLKVSGNDFNDAFREVTSIAPATNVAVMRSRKVGVGS